MLEWLMRWPPDWSYFFANVIIVDPLTGNIILSLSEDREEATPLGGEGKIGEQGKDAAAREVREETKNFINPSPDDLVALDFVIVHSIKGGDGIKKYIQTFVYFTKDTDKIPSVENQIYEEGCRIVKIIVMSFPEIWQSIEQEELNVFPNFIGTLIKLESFLSDKRNWPQKS